MYENLTDARAKLQSSLIYYKGRSVQCRELNERPVENSPDGKVEIYLRLNWLRDPNARNFNVPLSDPELGYMQFKLGYLNYAQYAVWCYRIPLRQYRQGLRHDQCAIRDESNLQPRAVDWFNFGANVHTGEMMEGSYPTFEEAVAKLDGGATKVAFHQNFAVYRDRMRKDYVLEYKGVPTAFGDMSSEFKCTDTMKHIRESIADLKIKVQ